MSDGVLVRCYGDDADAPCFNRQCPACGRFMTFPGDAVLHFEGQWDRWKDIDPRPVCSLCGPQRPELECYKGDLLP